MRVLLGALLLFSSVVFAAEPASPTSFKMRFGDSYGCHLTIMNVTITRCACAQFDGNNPILAPDKSNFENECFKKLYDAQSTDKMLSDLRAIQAAQMQTIKALIDQNYRTIANDPQFTAYINQRINQMLKERGL